MRNQLHTYTASIKGSDGICLNMIFDLYRFYENEGLLQLYVNIEN
jgi:hypothetical protein